MPTQIINFKIKKITKEDAKFDPFGESFDTTKEEVYSVGEIYKLKLLKTRLNKAVKSKSHVSKIVRSLPFKKFKTKTGHEANGLTIEQINEYNQNKLK